VNRFIWPVTVIAVAVVLAAGAVLTAHVLHPAAPAVSSPPVTAPAQHSRHPPLAPAVVLMCGTSFAVTGISCGQAQMVTKPATYGLSADGATVLPALTGKAGDKARPARMGC
jgi:hypothetical protein